MEHEIRDLMKMGLSENESKIYYHLLTGNYSATELAKLIGVNRSNSYKIINSLMMKGFCYKLNKENKFTAVTPSVAFKSFTETYQDKIDYISLKSSFFDDIFTAKTETNNLESVKLLHSKASILATLNKLEEQATSEVLSLCKPPYLFDESNVIEVQKTSHSKGVMHRSVYEITETSKEKLQDMKMYVELGEEIRVIPYLPLKLHVFDGKVAVINLRNKLGIKSDFTFAFFDHEDVAEAFGAMFKVYWDSAIPYQDFIDSH